MGANADVILVCVADGEGGGDDLTDLGFQLVEPKARRRLLELHHESMGDVAVDLGMRIVEIALEYQCRDVFCSVGHAPKHGRPFHGLKQVFRKGSKRSGRTTMISSRFQP